MGIFQPISRMSWCFGCVLFAEEDGVGVHGLLAGFGVEADRIVTVLLEVVEQRAFNPAGELFIRPDLLGDLSHGIAESGIAAFVGGKAAAAGEDAGAVVVVGIQFGSFALTADAGDRNGLAIGADKAFEGLVREGEQRNEGSGFHVSLGNRGAADEDVDFTIGQALLLLSTAVIGDGLNLAALGENQGAESQPGAGRTGGCRRTS